MGGTLLQFRQRGAALPSEGAAWAAAGGDAPGREALAAGSDLTGAGLGEPVDLDAVPLLPPVDRTDPTSLPLSGTGPSHSPSRTAATRCAAPRPPTRPGGMLEIEAALSALPLRNPLAVAQPVDIALRNL
jgi:hypothetical protein